MAPAVARVERTAAANPASHTEGARQLQLEPWWVGGVVVRWRGRASGRARGGAPGGLAPRSAVARKSGRDRGRGGRLFGGDRHRRQVGPAPAGCAAAVRQHVGDRLLDPGPHLPAPGAPPGRHRHPQQLLGHLLGAWKRPSRGRISARRQTSSSAAGAPCGDGGGSLLRSTSAPSARRRFGEGLLPGEGSPHHHPQGEQSERASSGSPRSCSGDM